MNPTTCATLHELRFDYLDRIGRAVVFPCDANGVVDVGSLSPALGESYLRARSRVGRDLASPAVLPSRRCGAGHGS